MDIVNVVNWLWPSIWDVAIDDAVTQTASQVWPILSTRIDQCQHLATNYPLKHLRL